MTDAAASELAHGAEAAQERDPRGRRPDPVPEPVLHDFSKWHAGPAALGTVNPGNSWSCATASSCVRYR